MKLDLRVHGFLKVKELVIVIPDMAKRSHLGLEE
jgi:hypothetical protein